MENKFIPDAIDIVSKAITADNEGEYEKALNLYRDALGRFTMGLKYGKYVSTYVDLIFDNTLRFDSLPFTLTFSRKKCSTKKTDTRTCGRIYETS